MTKLIITVSILFHLFSLRPSLTTAAGARWQLLQRSIGVSAMHMQQLNNDRVVVFDRTTFGPSQLALPGGKCRNGSKVTGPKPDYTAHSAEYDVSSNTFRALTVQTDVLCSSGAVVADGTLVQTGGFKEGERHVRVFKPCAGWNCDWQEINLGLSVKRWYATNHILPDGRQIIIGGRSQFNYEFYPKDAAKNIYSLPFLSETNDRGIENNLYPFVFLSPDGNLFIFANNRAIILNYSTNRVVKTFPQIPGGDPRSYPSSGSAVLLPLKNIQARKVEAEVLVCGAAPKGSYAQAVRGNFVEALKTCARIKISDPKPNWVVENMPRARVMGDMTLLPNGNVLIINGAGLGTAGFEAASNPVLNLVLYRPENKFGSRFEVQNPSTIPRMFHSTAVLLRDGRVLVGGSNPHVGYNFTVPFPTELSLEAYHPEYLEAKFANVRPQIMLPASLAKFNYSQKVEVRFRVGGKLAQNLVSVTLVSPSFTTHSFSMNQRLLVLPRGQLRSVGKNTYQVEVTMPGSVSLAPAGYYMLFVNHQEIPSEGVWVQLNN